MTKTKIYEINKHPKYQKYGKDFSRSYTRNKNTGTLGFQEVEVGNMSMDYITRPEFNEHKAHLDTRFDNVQHQIKEAVSDLKDEINDEKITSIKFWVGISVPAVISIIGILIQIFT